MPSVGWSQAVEGLTNNALCFSAPAEHEVAPAATGDIISI